jgi:tetratricopeptide (TPR) repeat protein
VFARVQARLQAAASDNALPALELRSRWTAASMAMGNARRALELITQNLQHAQGQPQSPVLASYSRVRATVLEALGRDEEALALFDSAARRAQADGDPKQAAAARCAALPAQLRMNQGDSLATAAAALAGTLGQLPKGLPATDEARRVCTMAQAELALAQGHRAEAEAALQTLLGEPRLARHNRAMALLLLSRAALADAGTPDPAAAAAAARSALELATQMQGQLPHSFRVAQAQAALGTALVAAGDSAASRQAFEVADTHFAATVEAGHPQWLQVQQRLEPRVQQQVQQRVQPR